MIQGRESSAPLWSLANKVRTLEVNRVNYILGVFGRRHRALTDESSTHSAWDCYDVPLTTADMVQSIDLSEKVSIRLCSPAVIQYQEAIANPRLSFVHDEARQIGCVPFVGKRVIHGS